MQPRTPSDLADPAATELVDVLETAAAAVEARFAVDAAGAVIGIELWPVPDADPCEVRLESRPAGPSGMPDVIEVRHGDELFGTFHVDEIRVESGAAEPTGETS